MGGLLQLREAVLDFVFVVLATKEVHDMKKRDARGREEHNPIGLRKDYSLSPQRGGPSRHGRPGSVHRHPDALGNFG